MYRYIFVRELYVDTILWPGCVRFFPWPALIVNMGTTVGLGSWEIIIYFKRASASTAAPLDQVIFLFRIN
jgi:hypothetical protein